MTAYDLGGHSAAQKLWKEYMNSGIDAVVYLVDVADQKRMDESKKALHKLLSYMPPECPGSTFSYLISSRRFLIHLN